MTTRIRIETEPTYDVVVGAGSLRSAGGALGGASGCVVVSDENVAPLYRTRLEGLADAPSITLPAGEETKSFQHLERLLDELASHTLDRNARLVALGGGVIGDLVGLAASLYMRGIGVVQCPTTLLSQVDSSVGGKTAVNLSAGKNLAGTFHQPSAVFADTETLATLSGEEFASGLGEVVKSGLLGDEQLLVLLETHADAILERDPQVLEQVVERCVRVKAAVVAADEREIGARRTLNLGHSFAHAIEHVAGFGRIPHGIAVGVGLNLALQASRQLGIDERLIERNRELLSRLGLPTSLEELRRGYDCGLDPSELAASLRLDKKSKAGEARFVLLEAVGRASSDHVLDGERVIELFG